MEYGIWNYNIEAQNAFYNKTNIIIFLHLYLFLYNIINNHICYFFLFLLFNLSSNFYYKN